MNKKLKKNKIKIFLIFDLVMLILFVMLFNRDVMPSKLHEVVGLVMLGFAAIHLILHPSYIIGVTKTAFSKNSRLSKKARFSYILNFLLLIILILMIISSISISQVVFKNSGSFFMKNLHKSLAALMILIGGIHIGLHYKMIALKLKLNKVFATILISIFLIFGIYSLATTNYTHYLISVISSSEGSNLVENEVVLEKHEVELEKHKVELEKHKGLGKLLSTLDFAGVGFTIISYGSIVFVFCFATHLVEDGLKRKKKKIK